MRVIVLIFIILPTILFGQHAIFYADTTRLKRLPKHEFKSAMEMEWIINGQKLYFGSPPIKIKTDLSTIDTILYKQTPSSNWTVIICNIKEPFTYRFIYNECCNAFNILSEKDKLLDNSVNFRISGQSKNQTFIGYLGETGIVIRPKSNGKLKPVCHSPLIPNVYSVSLTEVEICKDTVNCISGSSCLFKNGKEFNDTDNTFYFKELSTKFEFYFVLLSDKTTTFVYNPISKKITIQ